MKLKPTTLLFFCLAFASCFLTSCRSTKRQETQKTEVKTETTTENIIKYTDTTLFAPKAETTIKIPAVQLGFKSDLNAVQKPIYFTQKNGHATAKFTKANDTIYITATCDSLAMVAKIKNQLQKQNSNNSISDIKTSDEKTHSGFSFIELLVYSLAAFVVGFIVCFILKTFKIL